MSDVAGTRDDAFLGGRLVLRQPARGYRAGMDAVLLAAATVGGPAGGLVAGPLGATLGVLPADLDERVMLGDCGANAVGALLGLATYEYLRRSSEGSTLAAVILSLVAAAIIAGLIG